MPASDTMIEYLRRHAPDVVVLTALTYSRSQQLDVLKAARALGMPVAAAIMSWDHLSSKALIHVQPDQVIVWNDVQRDEAVSMHGVPADRIVATGAQCYDQWFTRTPERSARGVLPGHGAARRPAVRAVGALGAQPDPRPAGAASWWSDGSRRCAHSPIRGCAKPACWCGRIRSGSRSGPASTSRASTTSPFTARNPIDRDVTDDYFDSLYHSARSSGSSRAPSSKRRSSAGRC